MIFEAFLNTLSPSLCLSENDKTKNKNQKVDEENDDDEEGATKKKQWEAITLPYFKIYYISKVNHKFIYHLILLLLLL